MVAAVPAAFTNAATIAANVRGEPAVVALAAAAAVGLVVSDSADDSVAACDGTLVVGSTVVCTSVLVSTVGAEVGAVDASVLNSVCVDTGVSAAGSLALVWVQSHVRICSAVAAVCSELAGVLGCLQ